VLFFLLVLQQTILLHALILSAELLEDTVTIRSRFIDGLFVGRSIDGGRRFDKLGTWVGCGRRAQNLGDVNCEPRIGGAGTICYDECWYHNWCGGTFSSKQLSLNLLDRF
jgi:hypothetical protein